MKWHNRTVYRRWKSILLFSKNRFVILVWRNSAIVEIKKKWKMIKFEKFKRNRPFCFSLLRCCFHFKFYISNQHFLSIARLGKEKVVNAILKVVIVAVNSNRKAYFWTKSLAIKTILEIYKLFTKSTKLWKWTTLRKRPFKCIDEMCMNDTAQFGDFWNVSNNSKS